MYWKGMYCATFLEDISRRESTEKDWDSSLSPLPASMQTFFVFCTLIMKTKLFVLCSKWFVKIEWFVGVGFTRSLALLFYYSSFYIHFILKTLKHFIFRKCTYPIEFVTLDLIPLNSDWIFSFIGELFSFYTSNRTLQQQTDISFSIHNITTNPSHFLGSHLTIINTSS